MTLRRMDNVGIVIDDLPAAVAFFRALGREEDVLARLRPHGAELVGEVVQYETVSPLLRPRP